METITVALIGDPSDPWAGPQGGEITGDGEPYSALRKVDLTEVSHIELLGDVLRRAAEALSVSPDSDNGFTPSWIAFHRLEDELAYTSTRESTNVELVDEIGLVTWGSWFAGSDVTMRALLHSWEAGALDGDPRRPYLILRPGYGNGILPDWGEYLVILYAAKEVLGAVADFHGTTQALKSAARWAGSVLKRIRHTPDLVSERAADWEEHGGYPATVDAFLDRQPWSTEVLAPLLGCSHDDAESLLTGRGFTYNPSTLLWYPDGDATGRSVRKLRQAMLWFEWETDVESEAGKAELRHFINNQIRDLYLEAEEE